MEDAAGISYRSYSGFIYRGRNIQILSGRYGRQPSIGQVSCLVHLSAAGSDFFCPIFSDKFFFHTAEDQSRQIGAG